MGNGSDSETNIEEKLHPEAIKLANVPTQNVEAECAVLGALMQAGDNEEPFFEIQSELGKNSFYQSKHKAIYAACATLVSKQEPVDLVSVTGELEKTSELEAIGGYLYLDVLIDKCPTTANIKFYASQVRDAAIRRYLIRECARIAAMADDKANDIDEVVDKTEAAIMTIRENKDNGHLVDIKYAVNDTLKRLQALYDNDQSIIGLCTGFHRLDLKLSGMQSGQYIIVAGRPGIGKSTLVQNIIKHVAVDNKAGTVLFSVETSWEAFTMRLLSQESQENFQALRTGHIADWTELTRAISRLAEAPLWIDSSGGIKPSEMRGKLRQVQRRAAIKLIVVDYLQLMQSDGRQESRRLEIESISASLKALAQEFRCPLVACSQLSRKAEARPDKRPELADLRESGALEQDADVVLMLYREGVYKDGIDPKHAEVNIVKHRDGPVGKIYMNFDMGTMTFSEIDMPGERR